MSSNHNNQINISENLVQYVCLLLGHCTTPYKIQTIIVYFHLPPTAEVWNIIMPPTRWSRHTICLNHLELVAKYFFFSPCCLNHAAWQLYHSKAWFSSLSTKTNDTINSWRITGRPLWKIGLKLLITGSILKGGYDADPFCISQVDCELSIEYVDFVLSVCYWKVFDKTACKTTTLAGQATMYGL